MINNNNTHFQMTACLICLAIQVHCKCKCDCRSSEPYFSTSHYFSPGSENENKVYSFESKSGIFFDNLPKPEENIQLSSKSEKKQESSEKASEVSMT